MDRITVAKRALVVFSIGLGLAATLVPRRFCTLVCFDKSPEKIAASGARELAAGAALLSPVKPSPFLWTRVAGDATDLWGLATAFKAPDAKRSLLAAATAGVLAITLLDIVLAAEASRASR